MFFQFTKHYSELRTKSWTPAHVVARRFGFSAETDSVIPIYVLKLKGGQLARAVYDSEIRRARPI